MSTQHRLGVPRDMVVDSKIFSFSGGDNERGRFLRIFESGGGYPAGGSSLMISAGGQHSNLCAFGACVHNAMDFISNGNVQVGASTTKPFCSRSAPSQRKTISTCRIAILNLQQNNVDAFFEIVSSVFHPKVPVC